jgi:LytR cell envelope-related transcriptional attenuator
VEAFMLTNNHKEKRKSQEGIIYTLILVTYFSAIILVFIFSVKFISNTINSTLSAPQELENTTENQIDLKSYTLIENKLNLNQIITTTTPTSTNDTLLATTTSAIPTTTAIEVIEIMPKIVISNSTSKSGLAGILKDKLQAAGLIVLKTNTVKPTTKQTIIKIKDSFNTNSNSLAKIKKIVSSDYDFIIQVLEEKTNYDVEIIIGNK